MMTSDTVTLRIATARDYDTLGAVMHDAIRNGPSLYTPNQRAAWSPAPRHGEAWSARLSGKMVLMAEAGGKALGFMTLESGGYIDFAYIRSEAQGTGLFRKLFEATETIAIEHGEHSLSTHASLMAQPAFKTMGFSVDSHENVELNGQRFDRARMSKNL